jgi:hypothetical protein
LNRAYDILRSGAWVTPERIRRIAIAILCVAAVSIVFLLITAKGLVDLQGRPLGTDFSSFYSAGTYVLDGNAQAPYDLARQHAREQAIFGAATPLYSWFYPPFFLFITAALAFLPYGAALVSWQLSRSPAISFRFTRLLLLLYAGGRKDGMKGRLRRARHRPHYSSLRSPFRRCWSISVTAKMASSRPRCSEAPSPC